MVSTLIEKLQLKKGMKLAVLNAPAGYLDQLAQALAGIDLVAQAGGEAQAVLLFLTTQAEVEKLVPEAIRAVKEAGPVWIAYPKISSGVRSDLSRDILWPMVKPLGWHPVRTIAIDPVWTAMRFRPD